MLTTFQSDAASAHWRPSIPACRFQVVSPGAGAKVWFSCSQGWKWMVHITEMSCCSSSCCKTFCQAAGDFCFPAHHACTRALSCCDTRLRTSHQTWPPNRPVRPQFCRLDMIKSLISINCIVFRNLINEYVCVRLSETAGDVVDEQLRLLTEWNFTNRMTYYISQGTVEVPIRRGGQLCCAFVVNLL